MTANATALQGLPKAIEKAIEETIELEIASAVRQATERAKAEIEKRIPEIISAVALRVSKNFSHERFGEELVIRVVLSDTKRET